MVKDRLTQRKWDRAAKSFDWMNRYGPEKRWAPAKRELFGQMRGERILFLAVGTGLDIAFFPPGQHIDGLDISAAMLEVARPRAEAYPGQMTLHHMDVHEMGFPDNHFDQVFTSCTFCSVPDPVAGLQAVHRVLKPGGGLFMFEHTGSRYYPFRAMMNLMSPLTSRFGPEMNRDTVGNVQSAGFAIQQVTPIFLDVVKLIEARKPD